MASYNQFGLCCNRRERVVIIFRFGNSDETREAFNQRRQRCDQTNKDNALLNARSRDVIEELTERHWALMYLQHLATRVIQTNRLEIQFSDLPPIASLSVHDPESSSISLPPPLMYEESIEQHLEVLEQRIKDAQIGKEASWAALSTLALGLTSDIQDNPEDVEIAFRVFNDGSHARFFTGRGDIRCSNWQRFEISEPQERKGAERHIISDRIPTNYISISTSPRRIWNFAIRKPVKADQKIAIIDLRVLRRLGVAYGSSTDDLGFRPLNKTYGTGTMFATKYHLLVLGWLPPRSILGFLSIDQFEALLKQSHIDNSSSENISLPEYDKKIGFSSILQYLPAPAVISPVS
ncbi:hypothetical protein BP6252_13111 [Coleophoma cylindrospora]|uniref:DUF7587 domain-containing protein n=1 Tax=Coleophoma cylindrospora TaxID=1849047 RepID=A0A3D8Q9X0_9HELO|nr:hypothetical protein BP6252_13111 [Coleophoma cylindrospora]